MKSWSREEKGMRISIIQPCDWSLCQNIRFTSTRLLHLECIALNLFSGERGNNKSLTRNHYRDVEFGLIQIHSRYLFSLSHTLRAPDQTLSFDVNCKERESKSNALRDVKWVNGPELLLHTK